MIPKELIERLNTDHNFQQLVDVLTTQMRFAKITPEDMRSAASVAATIVERTGFRHR